MQRPVTTAREFERRLLGITGVSSVVAILLISLYLWLLLSLPSEQWWGFAQIVAGLFVLLFALSTRSTWKLLEPVLSHLSRRERGEDDARSLQEAFACLTVLPMRQSVNGVAWWAVGGVLVAGGMLLRYESFQPVSGLFMVLASLSGGFVSTTFLYFVYKRAFADLQAGLAEGIGDPVLRGSLVQPVSMGTKLRIAVTGVTFVTVAFGVCLAHVMASRRLEAQSVRVQSRLIVQELASGSLESDAGLEAAAARGRDLAVVEGLVLLDPRDGRVVAGGADLLTPEERRFVMKRPEGGDSLGMDSPNAFSWTRMDRGGPVVVAVLPWSAVAGGGGKAAVTFALLLAASGGIAFALARVLAGDAGSAVEGLRAEVERMASGDLRRGRVLESEDEFGALSRSFEVMVESVRGTVAKVTGAAERVGAAARELAAVAQGVAAGAADQGQGVQQASALMDSAGRQVAGIAGSAQELNLLVEESSSSILEMGAAGEELNDTAGVLSSKVDEVSSSIEQMVRSVKEVASTTESLSSAAGETSSSMEEMASAMRQVDVTAEETARLSKRVIESAEQGQEKVRQTIDGMESIRVATEAAEGVIRGLGARTNEIGAILDVIDDVADETNLLALNAAIIAAQAGDHGRAFSVVADEIKELADRVLSSTKEIGGVIRSVQEESTAAVGAIEEGSRSVASGVQLSMEAGTSLEEITRASRDSGSRIQEIVHAVREQTKAAAHVVELMERVNVAVESIERATQEQGRGNEVVFRSSVAMREVALQLRNTTEEQARGGTRIRESIDGVRDAVESINRALQVQKESNEELALFLEQVAERATANEDSARRMEAGSRELSAQAEGLDDEVKRFSV